MRRYRVELLALCALAVPALAIAEPVPVAPEARPHLDHGLERFAARDYAAAIAAFDAGFAIDPHPDFLYAKAQAQRLGGDCRAALVTYRAFLDRHPPEAEAELARGNVARCERVLAASRVPEPPRDEVRDLDPAPVAPAAAPAWWRDRPGLALAGASTVALLTSATFAIHARGLAGDSSASENLEDWQDREASWRRDRTIAGIALGVGAGLGVGATVRFWYVGRRTSPSLTVSPAGDGAALIVQGRW